MQKTRYGTYVMLLRAKIQSGVEDLAAFESHLLEENGLQRSHSSPTLHDSSQVSQVSQVSSTLDGGNSSKASGCSGSKLRQEGQRHSYRQAVKKWDKRGGGGNTASRPPAWSCLSTCKMLFIWDPGRFGAPISTGEGQDRGSHPRPPPESMTPLHATWSSSSGWGGWRRHQPAWRCREDELGVDRPVGSTRILLSTRAEDAAGRDVICPLLFSPSTSSSSPFGTKSIFDDWRCHQNWVENAVTDASILESLRSILFYLISFPTIAAVRPHSQEITSFSSCVFTESVDSSQGHLF